MDDVVLEKKLNEYKILSDLGNPIGSVTKFNLMFGVDIGATGTLKG
jgi:glycyl-tRNA synthetase (class II)